MLLAIDTSSETFGVALYDTKKNQTVFEQNVIPEPPKKHAEILDEILEDVINGRKWEDITRIGVVTGPGSFTGVRVGLATARGLALALNIPCNGVTVFEVLSFGFSDSQPIFCAVNLPTKKIGAQGFVSQTTPFSEPVVLEQDEAKCPEKFTRIVGSAATTVKKNSGDKKIQIVDEGGYSKIQTVAELVSTMPPTSKPEPVYLREPVVNKKQGKKR